MAFLEDSLPCLLLRNNSISVEHGPEPAPGVLRHIMWRISATNRFLSTFGETGWFGGFATFSRTQVGRGDHVVTEGKFLNSPRPGCHPYGITKSGQEPIYCVNQQPAWCITSRWTRCKAS